MSPRKVSYSPFLSFSWLSDSQVMEVRLQICQPSSCEGWGWLFVMCRFYPSFPLTYRVALAMSPHCCPQAGQLLALWVALERSWVGPSLVALGLMVGVGCCGDAQPPVAVAAPWLL